MAGLTSSFTITSPILPYIRGTYGRMIPKPSSHIKILELGMIGCIVKVSARDVGHKNRIQNILTSTVLLYHGI